MPERYHMDSYNSSFGAGSRRERSGGMQRTREMIDYGHGSSYSTPRYRGGGYGAGGSGSGGGGSSGGAGSRGNTSSILGNYGVGANTSGYNSTSSYGATPNYSNTTGYGGASTYDGGASYGGNTSYGDSSSYGGSSAYGHAGYNSGQVVSPWESGMAPPAAAGGNQGGFLPTPRGSGASLLGVGPPSTDIVGAVNQLTQMGSTESKLALNILNAVLNKGDERRPNVDIGPPANKMRRMEWDGGQGNRQGRTLSSPVRPSPVPVRKFPQRDHQYNPRRSWDNESPLRGRGGHSYGSAGRHIMTDNQFRKTSKIKRGRPRPDTKDIKASAKDQKEKNEATPAATTEAASGQKGNKPEGDGSSASTLSKQSGAKDDKDTETSDDKENAEEMDTAENDEEKELKTKKEAFIPKEILMCHMCDVDNFYSINCYQKHLESKAHKTTAQAYHAQGSAILEILRAEAKLASQRQILMAWKSGARGRNLMMCGKCQCRISGTLQEHNKTIEHNLVSQYLKVKCCGHAYNIRGALEEHRLSLLHFKWQMELEQEIKEMEKKKMENDGNISEETIMKMFHDAVEQHKANNCEEIMTSKTLPPYDPAVPVGMHLIGTKSHYRCNVCPGSRFRMVEEQQVQVHFRSIVHYQNVFAHVTKLQEQKDLEKKKKQEEKRKEQEKATVDSDKSGGEEESKDETDGAVKETTEESEKDENCEAMDVDSSADADKPTIKKNSKENKSKDEVDADDVTSKMDDECEMLEEVGEAYEEDEEGNEEGDEDGDEEGNEEGDEEEEGIEEEEGDEQQEGDGEKAEEENDNADVEKECDQKLEDNDGVDDEPVEVEVEEAPVIEEERPKEDKVPAKTAAVTSRVQRSTRARGRGRPSKN